MFAAARTVDARRRLAHLSLAVFLLATGAAAVILYRFPPAAYSFYPICPVYEYSHLECPGCGTTRALAALVHGHFREALHWNALTIGLMLPVAVAHGTVSYVRAVRGGAFRWPQLPTPAIYAGVGVILAFTAMRNV